MRSCFVACLVSLGLIACEASPVAPDGADLAISRVTVIDVATGSALADRTVWIGDGRILTIAGTAAGTESFNGTVIAADGQYLIPGLWDLHIHALTDPDDATARILPLFVAYGVTGVRDMGSVMDGLTTTRARLAADDRLVHPEIVAGGPLLDGQALPWYGDLPLVLETPEEVGPALTDLAAQGVDFFKVYDGLSPAVYEAIQAEAANFDLPVAGHVPRAVGLAGATAARQHTIEHLMPSSFTACVADPQAYFDRSIQTRFSGDYDAYFQTQIDWFAEAERSADCEQVIGALGEAGMHLTATLVMEIFAEDSIDMAALAYMPAGGRDWCETNLIGIAGADPALRATAGSALYAFAQRLRSAGVTLLAGSDTPNYCNVPGPSLHWELARLVAAGQSPADVLRQATLGAAEIARRPDHGRIAEGAVASLVVLDANPLEDIAATQAIAHVIHDGRAFDRLALETLRAQAATAAADMP